MSVLFENNKSGLPSKTSTKILLFYNIGIFVLPLVFLLLHKFFSNKHSFFDIEFFFYGSLLELCFSIFLLVQQYNDRISKKSLVRLDFINKTIIGLPFTVYLAAAHPLNLISIVRYLPTLMLLTRSRKSGLFILYSIFFTGGCFIYLFFQNYNWPSVSEILFLTIMFLFSILVAFASFFYWSHHKNNILEKRKSFNYKRELSLLKKRTQMVLQDSLPTLDCNSWFSQRSLNPIKGHAITIVFQFSGLHHFLNVGENETSTKNESLQHDWNLLKNTISNEFKNSEYYRSQICDESITMACFVEIEKFKSGLAVATILVINKILEFHKRSQNSNLKRGLSFFEISVSIEIEYINMYRISANNPGIFFTGNRINELKMKACLSNQLQSGPVLNDFLSQYFPDLQSNSGQWQNPGHLSKSLNEKDFYLQ